MSFTLYFFLQFLQLVIYKQWFLDKKHLLGLLLIVYWNMSCCQSVTNLTSNYILYTGIFLPRVIFVLLYLQFRTVLNSPKHSCVLSETIWDIRIRPPTTRAKGMKTKQGRIFPLHCSSMQKIPLPSHSPWCWWELLLLVEQCPWHPPQSPPTGTESSIADERNQTQTTTGAGDRAWRRVTGERY